MTRTSTTSNHSGRPRLVEKESPSHSLFFIVLLTPLSILLSACEAITPVELLCRDSVFASMIVDQGNTREGQVHREYFWRTTRASYSMSVDLSLAEFCRAQRFRDEPTEVKLAEASAFFHRSGWPQFFRLQATARGDALPEVVARFLQQSIPYKTSPTPAWLPIEVLVHGSGDCDDRSVFATALLQQLGVPSAYLEFGDALDRQRHATLGIVAPEIPGYAVQGGNQRYVSWEVTPPGGEPGVNFFPSFHPIKIIPWGTEREVSR